MRIYRNIKAAAKGGGPYGTWRLALPDGRSISLGTYDRAEAERKMLEYGKDGAADAGNGAQVSPPASDRPLSPPPARRDPREIFAEWAGKMNSDSNAPVTPDVAAPPAGRLSPSQSSRISGGLAKLCTMVNTLAVGATVKVFGKKPAELDDDEEEIIKVGWEMQWDEWLANRQARPWMLIIAGSVGAGVVMYVEGEPLPDDAEETSGDDPAAA